LPVCLRHQYVRDDLLTVIGPDPDAVAVELISDIFESGAGVVMVNDVQGVGVGHGTHRSLSGLGQPRCVHAAGVSGRMPGYGLPRPWPSMGGAGDSCGQAALWKIVLAAIFAATSAPRMEV
jgi:hypothetical protein